MNTVNKRHIALWLGLATVLFLIVLLVAFCHPPLVNLDSQLHFGSGQWPFLLRLPLSLVLLALTVWPLLLRQNSASTPWQACLLSRPVWSTVLVLTVVCCRWSVITSFAISSDESESISAARVLLHDGRFWQSVDVGTHGPVVSFWQTLLPRVGFAIDYASSRLLGTLMISVAVLCIYAILGRVAREGIARFIVLPRVFVVAGIGVGEYIQYNGEHPLLLLLMLGSAASARALFPRYEAEQSRVEAFSDDAERTIRLRLLVAGICGGAIPWAKIQGVPLAFALIVATGVGCWMIAPLSSSRVCWNRLFWYGIGLASPSLSIALWAVVVGSFVPMARSYFEWNLVYAQIAKSPHDFHFVAQMIKWALQHFVTIDRVQTLAQPVLVMGWCLLVLRIARRSEASRTSVSAFRFVALLGVLLTVAGWYSALAPGNQFSHYLLLPLLPVWLVGLTGWAGVFAADSSLNSRGVSRPVLMYGILGVLLPWGIWGFLRGPHGGNGALVSPFQYYASRENGLGDRVVELTRPDDFIEVWGWMPDLYVATKRQPATRTAACLREAYNGLLMQDYFFHLYLSDFDKKRPVVFVDEVRVTPEETAGPKQHSALKMNYDVLVTRDPEAPSHLESDFLHERYPELDQRIRANYTLVEVRPDGIRIYLRNDRLQNKLPLSISGRLR